VVMFVNPVIVIRYPQMEMIYGWGKRVILGVANKF